MEFQKLELDGAALISPQIFADERGFFVERFRLDEWLAFEPIHRGFVQDNYSWSKANVLRGLHFQLDPAQGKLITCVEGTTLDVIVDIRKNSSTFGRHLKIDLSSDKPQWLWVPSGFAHGFCVTSSCGAGLLYKVDQPYSPSTEGAIRWNDPELGIKWPLAHPILSRKDAEAKSFTEYCISHLG